jgi:hypothetical protein
LMDLTWTQMPMHGNSCVARASRVVPLACRALDLSDTQFGDSYEDFLETDPLFNSERLAHLDQGIRQCVLQLRRLTGFGEQEQV